MYVVQMGSRIGWYSPQPSSCVSALGVARVWTTVPGFVWTSEAEEMRSVKSELRIGVMVNSVKRQVCEPIGRSCLP